jgi:hypothetical protein
MLWLAALAAAALAGCSGPVASTSAMAIKQADPTEEMVDSVRETLRKPYDQAASRRLVEQMNVYLGRSGVTRKPEPLSAAEREFLEKDFALRPEEVAEVSRPEFTPLDANYLDETLLYRDVARALDAAGVPPAERATAALAWVVRNFRNGPAKEPAVPPAYAALRGLGSPLERTYVLLTLLRQLGLDVCLIGDGSPSGSADGLWAVGVLTDGQIYLYDARLGLPLPGPDGQGVATLAQVRGSPDPFKPLALDPKLPYDVTAERAKQSRVFLSVPMTSLSPRMRFLQGLAPEGTVRLAADLPALRERFRAAAGDAEVGYWNPPAPDALPRLLYGFLPPNEGGTDRSMARMTKYYRDPIPWDRLPPLLAGLQGEPGDRMRSAFVSRCLLLSQPGQAHDLILRGQFDAATDQLVNLRSQITKRPLSEGQLEENTQLWVEEARKRYGDLLREERAVEKGDLTAIARRDEAKKYIDALWQGAKGPMMYVEVLTSEPLMAESTYLLALCKHEQAERQRAAQRGAPDRSAWQAALTYWNQFVNNYPTSPAVPAARRNQAFALEGAGRTAEARAAYAALQNSTLSPLEKLAVKYWESKLK